MHLLMFSTNPKRGLCQQFLGTLMEHRYSNAKWHFHIKNTLSSTTIKSMFCYVSAISCLLCTFYIFDFSTSVYGVSVETICCPVDICYRFRCSLATLTFIHDDNEKYHSFVVISHANVCFITLFVLCE